MKNQWQATSIYMKCRHFILFRRRKCYLPKTSGEFNQEIHQKEMSRSYLFVANKTMGNGFQPCGSPSQRKQVSFILGENEYIRGKAFVIAFRGGYEFKHAQLRNIPWQGSRVTLVWFKLNWNEALTTKMKQTATLQCFSTHLCRPCPYSRDPSLNANGKSDKQLRGTSGALEALGSGSRNESWQEH